MKIYSMTATFGKLEQATLTLQPGLNIIEAPNEWGKSTWCAFLTAMLYGLDTRQKSTKTALADKEHYAPWSGSPMEGRIDLNWNGRDITIERKTRGRIPLGDFRAYETESGLAVPELTAANCGQMLLGMERSVFLRSGFIRLSDLPVTNDEALRRRLNALVTTGDESSAGDRLNRGLKELKNRVRYNRTGLLHQAEGELAALEGKLAELDGLRIQIGKLNRRLAEVDQWLAQLENHKTALAYQAAQQDAARVREARQRRDEAASRLDAGNLLCEALPEPEQIQWMLGKMDHLEESLGALEMEEEMLQKDLLVVEKPGFVGSLSPEEALDRAKTDAEQYRAMGKSNPAGLILSLLAVIAGVILTRWYRTPGFVLLGVGCVFLLEVLLSQGKRKKTVRKLLQRYESGDPAAWLQAAEEYRRAVGLREETARQQAAVRADIQSRRGALTEKINRITQGKGLRQCRLEWETARERRNAQADASRDYQKAEHHYQTLKAMAKTAPLPDAPDELTCSEADTARLLSDGYGEKHLLQSRISQYQGRMEALGDGETLKAQLAQVKARIQKLEDIYGAVTIAQENLARATAQLQRRFAPRIAKRAQEMLAILTDGRYDRLRLGEDLGLLAGAEQETVLREALWRSDGTVDQLYLALRLSVAEELTPDAPLILDDALVRFDDTRLKAALKLLKAQSEGKQVILFSCQSREKNLL